MMVVPANCNQNRLFQALSVVENQLENGLLLHHQLVCLGGVDTLNVPILCKILSSPKSTITNFVLGSQTNEILSTVVPNKNLVELDIRGTVDDDILRQFLKRSKITTLHFCHGILSTEKLDTFRDLSLNELFATFSQRLPKMLNNCPNIKILTLLVSEDEHLFRTNLRHHLANTVNASILN